MAGTEIDPEVCRKGRPCLYVTLHCHHQNDFCITMDSNECHFNVSFTVKGKVTIRQCP